MNIAIMTLGFCAQEHVCETMRDSGTGSVAVGWSLVEIASHAAKHMVAKWASDYTNSETE